MTMGGCDFEAKRFSVPVGESEAYRENYDRIFKRGEGDAEPVVEPTAARLEPQLEPPSKESLSTTGRTLLKIKAQHFRDAAKFMREGVVKGHRALRLLDEEADRLDALANEP